MAERSRLLWPRLLLAHVLRLQPLRALDDVELDPVPLGQRAEAVHLDGRVMDEDILARLLRDEPESLAVVEPLHSTLRHEGTFSCCGRVRRPVVSGRASARRGGSVAGLSPECQTTAVTVNRRGGSPSARNANSLEDPGQFRS